MIKKLLSVAMLSLLLSACSTNSNVVKIVGKVDNAIPQGEILLERYEQGRPVPVTTVNSDHKGNFEIEVEVSEPGFYRINVYGQQFGNLVLHKDNLKVVAEGQGGSEIKITGSRDMDNLDELNEYIEGFSGKIYDFNQRYMAARQAGDRETMESMVDEGMAIDWEKTNGLKKLAMSFDKSLVSLMVVDHIQNKTDEYYFLDSLGQKLTKEFPNSSHVQLFTTNLEYLKPAIGLGDLAPEITLPTPDGDEMSLSSLKGKYVLLDFWAGWCRPCRMENPNVVAMYNKYNAQGFEVFSVSLDRSRDKWVNAIAADGLRWPNHVSDLKHFKSAAALEYRVNAIPFALLLDTEGRVIGKNLRGRRLQAKLAEIFGSEGE